MASTSIRQMIHGVEVSFPCKPYPSQFSMMEKVIKGIERKQNCLLESPTGSGKSLALLCSALAWQSAEFEKKAKEDISNENKKDGKCSCSMIKEKDDKDFNDLKKWKDDILGLKNNAVSNGIITQTDEMNDDDDDDFINDSKKTKKHLCVSYETSPPMDTTSANMISLEQDMSENGSCCCSCSSDKSSSRKVPKIYFGTRTHKQISQITRELKKTVYKEARMTILAAREHTCIHREISKVKNKNEGCKELLDGPGCKFNDRVKRILPSQMYVKKYGLEDAWDIEDFVGLCKKHTVCPYFATRGLMKEADVIFCPYNYLIDPVVRSAMEINLKDQIVILDEAHNIEDCARDSASDSFNEDQLDKAIKELDEMIKYDIKVSEHLRIRQVCSGLRNLISDNVNNLRQMDYDHEYKDWSGFDIVARLDQIGIGVKHFQEIQKCMSKIMEDLADKETIIRDVSGKEIKLSSLTLTLLEHIFKVLDYMYRLDLKFVPDYRMAVVKSTVYTRNQDTNDQWLNPRQRRRAQPTLQYALNFWCMNPGVAFSDFTVCRNVVLTSGTLSPMLSFESELGMPFPIKLEANHVIEDKQVWVGAIGHGPNGNSLQAVYKSMETWSFQDELGSVVLNICQTVPYGVLCFMPSYKAVEKFKERWQRTGVWEKIEQRKRIIVEPRKSENVDFEALMKSFYKTIQIVQDEGETEDGLDGALFIAVCRGKVSEGLDFADNNARAVITIGIPYPNFTDIQVKLKREYNDMHKNSRGLLSGSEWYEIQAFRALNQALGRCIRHRKDWGALILVDERFVKNTPRYCKGLSKWVRNKVQTFGNFRIGLDSLTKFTKRCQEDMPVMSMDTSFIPCTPSTPAGPHKQFDLQASPLTSMIPEPSVLQRKTSPNDSFTDISPKDVSKNVQAANNVLCAKQSILSPTEVHQSQCLQGALNQRKVIATKAQANNQFLLQISNQGHMTQQAMQQILQVINLPHTPKGKPYYIILNEGTPQQQMYLIEPPAKPPQDASPSNINTQQLSGVVGHNIVSNTGNLRSLLSKNMPNASDSKLHQTTDGQVISGSRCNGTAKQQVISPAGKNTEIRSEETSCNRVEPSTSEKRLTKEGIDKAPDQAVICEGATTEQVKGEKQMTPSKGQAKVKSPQTPNLFDGDAKEKSPSSSCNIVTKLNFDEVSADADSLDKVQQNPTRKPLFKKRPRSMPAPPSFDEDDDDFKKPRLSLKRKSLTSATPQKEQNESIQTVEDHPEKIHSGDTDKQIVLNISNNKEGKSSNKEVIDTQVIERGVKTHSLLEKEESEKQAIEEAKESKMKGNEEVRKHAFMGEQGSEILTELKEEGKKNRNTEEEGMCDEDTTQETLNVRRSKRGVKRKTYSNTKTTVKRSKVEQDLLDHISNDKENKSQRKMLPSCVRCGTTIISTSKDFERSGKVPTFLKNVTKQDISEVLNCDSVEVGKGVQVLTTNVQGLHLDSFWDAEEGCCIQLLQCTVCFKKQKVETGAALLGAKIVCLDSTYARKEYHVGQTWLLSSAVNLTQK